MAWRWCLLALWGVAAEVNHTNHSNSTNQTEGAEVEQGSKSSVDNRKCGRLSLPVNDHCRVAVEWAAGGGKWDPQAPKWFQNLEVITGVGRAEVNLADFQRLYYCAPPGWRAGFGVFRSKR